MAEMTEIRAKLMMQYVDELIVSDETIAKYAADLELSKFKLAVLKILITLVADDQSMFEKIKQKAKSTDSRIKKKAELVLLIVLKIWVRRWEGR